MPEKGHSAQGEKRRKSAAADPDTPALFRQRLAALRSSTVHGNRYELRRLLELATGREERTARRLVESMPSDLKANLEMRRFSQHGKLTHSCTAEQWIRVRAWLEAVPKHEIQPWKEDGIRLLMTAIAGREDDAEAAREEDISAAVTAAAAEVPGCLLPAGLFTCGVPQDQIVKLVERTLELEEIRRNHQHELELQKVKQQERRQIRKEEFVERALSRRQVASRKAN